MAIKQRICPSCLDPVYTAIRYSKQIKSELNLIDAVKEQQEHILQRLTDEEKYNIINAMNEESVASINNIVGGRWFVCRNQHPYFIGKTRSIDAEAILIFFLQ
jgi:ribosomal protein L31